uniref:Uncharacterized protein n=1 Tax=Arundo donax TaxID=35708 RepID=A0A0A9CXY3_ARUDO
MDDTKNVTTYTQILLEPQITMHINFILWKKYKLLLKDTI